MTVAMYVCYIVGSSCLVAGSILGLVQYLVKW